MNVPSISLTRRPRGRDIHEENRVSTPLELLFDLTFVVAIASAASLLHHGAMEGHLAQTSIGFVMAFFAIWWAWMNYTWFASAYDDDSAVFRILTMLQMFGVLIFATGVPGIFKGDFRAGVTGYAVMRVALAIQWYLAAQGDPRCRTTCMRYFYGIIFVQALWIARWWFFDKGYVPSGWGIPVFIALAAADLSVPVFAERGEQTPWHGHHIAERYSLLLIITLGECVLGATNSVASMWQAHGWSLDLALVGLGSTLLVFCLWWMYFLMPSGDSLHHHRERAFGWGYSHFFVFVSAAAIGGSLEVVADVLRHAKDNAVATEAVVSKASPLFAISMLAGAVILFQLSLWFVFIYVTRRGIHHLFITLLCAALVLLAPIAVYFGLDLPWAMLLLCVGPIVAIVFHEHERRHCLNTPAVA